MPLPIFKSDDRTLMLLQSGYGTKLNPLLSNPLNQGQLLTGISLISGTTVINHKLGRKMVGWFLTDLNASATIFRPATAPFNELTLTLTSSALVTANLYVF